MVSFLPDVETKLFLKPLPTLRRELGFFRKLERVWSYIETNFHDQELTLQQAAKDCGIDNSQLNALLKRTTGFTFHRLLTRYRLFKAIQLMQEKDYGISEIAFDVGFGTVRSFERNFERIFHSHPKEFRNQLKTQT